MLIMIDDEAIINMNNVSTIHIKEYGSRYKLRYFFDSGECMDGGIYNTFKSAQNELKHILHCYGIGEKILML